MPPYSDYRLLVGHARTDGSWKSGRALRMEYLHLTDRLIFTLTDGVEQPGGAVVRPDVVVYLDKSARPISWLLRDAWHRLAPAAPDAPPPPLPETYFLNIDRMQWITTVDPHGQGYMDVDRIDETVIRSLRSVFIAPHLKRAGLTPALDALPTALDGKNVLIVDEVYSSGRTADISSRMLRRAFPTATVVSAHWMGGLVTRAGAVGNADLPVWYNESSEYGRGVGNRQIGGGTDRLSDNLTQRLGAWFLSSRLPALDERAQRLRGELRMLARHPDVPIRPAFDRDDVIERTEWLNGRPFDHVREEIAEILDEKAG